MAFPVLSSFNEGPFVSVSRKKYFPFTASMVAISLSSCMQTLTSEVVRKRKEKKSQEQVSTMGNPNLTRLEVKFNSYIYIWEFLIFL